MLRLCRSNKTQFNELLSNNSETTNVKTHFPSENNPKTRFLNFLNKTIFL